MPTTRRLTMSASFVKVVDGAAGRMACDDREYRGPARGRLAVAVFAAVGRGLRRDLRDDGRGIRPRPRRALDSVVGGPKLRVAAVDGDARGRVLGADRV